MPDDQLIGVCFGEIIWLVKSVF